MRFGIRGKLLMFAALVWAVIFGIYSLYIYKERIAQTRRMAVTAAGYLSREMGADRRIYSSTVVKRAFEAGLQVTTNYLDRDRAIPTPEAFLREVSHAVGSKGGFNVRLISKYPVNPSSAPSDDFQKNAVEALYSGSDTRYYRFEKFEGMESVRYMVPDVATSQTCVDCHNSNPASPRRDYKIGDIMGGLEIILPIESELEAAMADIWRSIGYGFVVILTMGLAGLAFLRYVVTSPILNLLDTTRMLATGDLTATSGVKANDEIGDLAAETNEVVMNLHGMIEEMRRVTDEAVEISGRVRELSRGVLEGSNKQGGSLDSIGSNMEGINGSITEIAGITGELAKSLEKGSASVAELGSSVSEVVENTESLFAIIDETAQSTRDMSFSIKETSESIENLSLAVMQVSTSMAQINARIKEVESNASEASRFAEEVIRDARAGMESVESTKDGILRIKDITGDSARIINALRDRIKEIGKILDVIRDVSEETNLLALNAAIIAAQSGEHGKSFAVVANEIKDLAERTSTSAKEVTEIIQAVEAESKKAGSAMERGFESVEEGVRLSMEAGEGLKKIVESAQRSTTSVREIARASADQARESRMVVDSAEKVAEMTRRIVSATQEQARGSELITGATERMSEIAYRVKSSTRSQAEANIQITRAVEEINGMVSRINNLIREQSRNTSRVLGAIGAVKKVSMENIEKAMETDRSIEELSSLNRTLMESVKRFKLRK